MSSVVAGGVSVAIVGPFPVVLAMLAEAAASSAQRLGLKEVLGRSAFFRGGLMVTCRRRRLPYAVTLQRRGAPATHNRRRRFGSRCAERRAPAAGGQEQPRAEGGKETEK